MEEYYGSEPPNNDKEGWVYVGGGKWTRGQSRKKSSAKGGPRVAIVGGGPGGLFAAYILNQRMPDAHVTIFEASDRCGGKIYTDEFSDGTPFEAGVAEMYEYKGPGGEDPLRLLIEDDLDLETVDIAGGAVVLRNKVLRDLDEVEMEHGSDTRKRIDAFHRKVVDLMPLEKYAQRWQPDNDHPWANKTFRECIEEELLGPDGVDEVAREYIETAVASDLATESHTCNGLNGIKNVLMDNDQYMQVYHVVGGIECIVDELLDRIKAKVRRNARVTGICKVEKGEPQLSINEGDPPDVVSPMEIMIAGTSGVGAPGSTAPQQDGGVGKPNDGGYHVRVLKIGDRTLKESEYEFDAVIVAVPNHWLRMIKWEGQLACAIHRIIAHYDLPAHYLRVSLLFDSKWWEDLDIPGEFWMMDMLNGCCCYDESTRWGEPDTSSLGNGGHILSFLLAGGDALLLCSSNQDDECIVDYLLQSMPEFMRQDAEDHLVEARVDRYVGSINAQPGGWPAEELRGEHKPCPDECPGIFLVGDYFFDSTLNAALMSANVAVELLLEFFGRESAKVSEAIELLSDKDTGV